MKPFTDAACLGPARPCLSMLDFVLLEMELVRMSVQASTIFGPTIGRDPKDRDALLLEEGQYLGDVPP